MSAVHGSSRLFRQLPTKFDVHEWAIMRDFSYSVPSDTTREDLLNGIHASALLGTMSLDEALPRTRNEPSASCLRQPPRFLPARRANQGDDRFPITYRGKPRCTVP